MTFEELYRKVLKDRLWGRSISENVSRRKLDCLFHPDKYPLVWKNEPCDCEDAQCVTACMFRALEVRDGKVTMNAENCTGCAQCIEACQNKNLTFSHDAVKVVEILKSSKEPVYAMMAPAYIGQFGEEATPGKIRSALKGMGFAGMIEVAAFADILTLKESLEFCENMDHKEGFQLTSCCCPIWISMIRKEFEKIAGHLPQALEVDFSKMEEDENEHSAAAGRLYARTGGVSQAVKESLASLDEKYDLKPVCACGVAECKEMLQKILDGHVEGNFFEGMACPGGCVGGPKRIMEIEKTTELVNEYADQAKYRTPGENPYVLDLIQRLGFHTVEDFIENSRILTRTF